jgi:outer membrane protein OmpA-like peptidoglycan-associated protein
MTAKGYGATRPVASNQTEEGRSRNRRTAFEILP